MADFTTPEQITAITQAATQSAEAAKVIASFNPTLATVLVSITAIITAIGTVINWINSKITKKNTKVTEANSAALAAKAEAEKSFNAGAQAVLDQFKAYVDATAAKLEKTQNDLKLVEGKLGLAVKEKLSMMPTVKAAVELQQRQIAEQKKEQAALKEKLDLETKRTDEILNTITKGKVQKKEGS